MSYTHMSVVGEKLLTEVGLDLGEGHDRPICSQKEMCEHGRIHARDG